MNAQPKRTPGLFLVPLHHRGLDVLGRSECMALERFLDGAERKSHTQWKFRPVWRDLGTCSSARHTTTQFPLH